MALGLKLALSVFGALALVDVTMLLSNMLKIPQGGWLPLAIAAAVFVVMETWRIGRRAHLERIRSESMPMALFLERAEKTPVRVAGTAVFLSARNDVVPGALLHNLKHNKVLHERVILCNVVVADQPLVPPEKRLEVNKLGKGFLHGAHPSRLLRDAGRAARPGRGAPLRHRDRRRDRDLLHRP
ncbi:MAG: KUP/HAK/KT family potassium transporter [Rhizomicrobium sp.]